MTLEKYLVQLRRRRLYVPQALDQRRQVAGDAIVLAVRVLRRLCSMKITWNSGSVMRAFMKLAKD